ncbi:hypothetical protein F5882DRAFT_416761 [Hyaloscypha sp. PMI_1271]|nr:hypothetical protein F5882DRAFT_416761 [Hyaloscypha sp. PMI_1271]
MYVYVGLIPSFIFAWRCLIFACVEPTVTNRARKFPQTLLMALCLLHVGLGLLWGLIFDWRCFSLLLEGCFCDVGESSGVAG